MSRRDLRLSKGSILRNAHGEDRLLSSSIWFILGEQLKFLSQICPWQVSCQGLVDRGPDVAGLERQPIVLHRLTGVCRLNHPPLRCTIYCQRPDYHRQQYCIVLLFFCENKEFEFQNQQN